MLLILLRVCNISNIIHISIIFHIDCFLAPAEAAAESMESHFSLLAVVSMIIDLLLAVFCKD